MAVILPSWNTDRGVLPSCKSKSIKTLWRKKIEERMLKVESVIVSPSPGQPNTEWFEAEHKGRDPKDGELYLSRMKPGETLVEVRRGTDVQIVRPTWV